MTDQWGSCPKTPAFHSQSERVQKKISCYLRQFQHKNVDKYKEHKNYEDHFMTVQ